MINSLSLRSNYKTLKKFTYLNQASLGLISEKTATSMIEFLNEIAKHGNAHMSDQDEVNFFETFACIHKIIRDKMIGLSLRPYKNLPSFFAAQKEYHANHL